MRLPPYRFTALVLALLVGAVLLAGVATGQSATLVHSGENISLEAGEGQEIVGQTTLDPGSTVTVRIQSENAAAPFLMQPQAEVDDDGRFRAYVDLSSVEPGSSASVTVLHDGERLTTSDATVSECDGGCLPAAAVDRDGDSLTLRAGPGQRVTGDTSLDSGTSVTVHLESESAEQPFHVAKETLVADDGTFSTRLDLSDVRAGTPLRVSVQYDGHELTETRGEVVACDGDCEPEVTATPTPRPTVPTDELGLESLVVTSTAETAAIPIGLGDADAATLRVGSERVNYVTSATVRDGNGDDRVTVLFDAAAAGREEPTFSVADDADELVVRDREPDVQGGIDPAEYEMNLYAGASSGDDPADIGTLVVRESTPTESGRLTLEKGFLQAQRGETPSIPVRLGDADAATVSIGNADANYRVNATVRDGNDDGRVALSFRTAAAGTDDSTLAPADEADEVTVTDSEPSFEGPLPATQYEVTLYRGAGATGDPTSIGTLSVVADGTERSETPALDDSRAGSSDLDLGGVGALAAGALFAVLGVGLLLGLFRS